MDTHIYFVQFAIRLNENFLRIVQTTFFDETFASLLATGGVATR